MAFPTNGSAEAAVEPANGTGSDLHVVYVVPMLPELVANPHVAARDRRRAALYFGEGRPEKETVRLGEELEAGLIVADGERAHSSSALSGFSESVSRRSDRPVLVASKERRQQEAVRG